MPEQIKTLAGFEFYRVRPIRKNSPTTNPWFLTSRGIFEVNRNGTLCWSRAEGRGWTFQSSSYNALTVLTAAVKLGVVAPEVIDEWKAWNEANELRRRKVQAARSILEMDTEGILPFKLTAKQRAAAEKAKTCEYE